MDRSRPSANDPYCRVTPDAVPAAFAPISPLLLALLLGTLLIAPVMPLEAAESVAPPPWPHPLRASASRKAAALSYMRAAKSHKTEPSAIQQPARLKAIVTTRGSVAKNATPPAPVQRSVLLPPDPRLPVRRSDPALANVTKPPQSAGTPPHAGEPPLPGHRAPPTTDVAATAPSVKPPAGPAEQATAQVEQWSQEAIQSAAKECDELLSSIVAEAQPQGPLRQGICGSAMPVALSAVGGDGNAGEVSLKPAALLNCPMVSRVYRWLETVAQPAAQRFFNARIVRLRNASSYVCRNRYNDPAAKISEHAFANALDVAAFELSDGRVIDVRSYWGDQLSTPTLKKGASDQAAKPISVALKSRAVTAALAQSTNARVETAAAPGKETSPETTEFKFLKELHGGACGIFTTVLGPLANAAHNDHFHFDLAKRRYSAYCQ